MTIGATGLPLAEEEFLQPRHIELVDRSETIHCQQATNPAFLKTESIHTISAPSGARVFLHGNGSPTFSWRRTTDVVEYHLAAGSG